jgi:hypothetical protein
MSLPSSGQFSALFDDLAATRKALLRSANDIPEEKWKATPAPGKWSAGEVFAHLTQVEQKVVEVARKELDAPPRRISALQRLHWPLWMVEVRVRPARTPIPLEPALVRDKPASIADLEASRRGLMMMIEDNLRTDLFAYHFKHPLLGYLNAYEWFLMLARHEARHRKQLVEIAAALAKD